MGCVTQGERTVRENKEKKIREKKGKKKEIIISKKLTKTTIKTRRLNYEGHSIHTYCNSLLTIMHGVQHKDQGPAVALQRFYVAFLNFFFFKCF